MAQHKPEDDTTLQQVIKLVHQLTPAEQEQVINELKLESLRRETQKAEDELLRGEGIPAEVALAELRQRAEDRLNKNQQ